MPGHHSERQGALTFLPNGRLVVGDVEGVIKIWELTDGEPTLIAGPLVRARDEDKDWAFGDGIVSTFEKPRMVKSMLRGLAQGS